MPTYTFLREDGLQLQRIYPINNVPSQIVCDDGIIAKKIFKTCNFTYSVNNVKQEDKKKRQEEQNDYMQRFGVAAFNPLKGQSQQQTKKDFQAVKYKMQQQLQEKKIIRKAKQQEKRQKRRKSFNETARLYFKGKEQKKQRQFEKNKLVI